MRIVHAVEDYRPSGGIATYLHSLVDAQRRLGHDVQVLARRGSTGLNLDALRHLPPAKRPQLWHEHDAWWARRVPDLFEGAARIRTLHNFAFSCSTGTRYHGDGRPCDRLHGLGCVAHWPSCGHTVRIDQLGRKYASASRERQGVLAADGVIANSRYTAGLAAGTGVDTERLTVLPCPRTDISIDPDYEGAVPGRVLYVGRLSNPKGVDVLIRALRWLPDAHLRVVGAGPSREGLEQLALREAEGRVEFVGWSSGVSLWEEYRGASVVAMPNRWPEPLGLVGLEAAWAGRPIVASNTGGVKEWLVPGVSGLGVRPGVASELAEALDRVLRDRAYGATLGIQARNHIEGWVGPEQHARAVLAFYDSVVARANLPGA